MFPNPFDRLRNNPQLRFKLRFIGLSLQNMLPQLPNFYQLRSNKSFLIESATASLYCFHHSFNMLSMLPPSFQLSFLLHSFPEKKKNDPFMTFPALQTSTTDEKTLMLLEGLLKTYFSSYKPDLFPISEILSWASEPKSHTPTTDALKYYILERCDSALTPTFAAMNKAVRQLASQFNLGESPSRELTHPKEFSSDHTQGPAEQSASVFAALLRWIHRDTSDGMVTLQAYEEFNQHFDYQFGYLTPRLGHEEEGLAFLKTHVEKIKLNVQRVGIDGTDQTAIQVLNSALALGPYDPDREKRTEEGNRAIREMSELLLTEQFKAVAAVTIKEARQNPWMRIPVIFTPVGGGVYSNEPDAIKAALRAACDLIEKSRITNIDVCLSAYQPGEADIFKSEHFLNAPAINQETLSRLQNLSNLTMQIQLSN